MNTYECGHPIPPCRECALLAHARSLQLKEVTIGAERVHNLLVKVGPSTFERLLLARRASNSQYTRVALNQHLNSLLQQRLITFDGSVYAARQ